MSYFVTLISLPIDPDPPSDLMTHHQEENTIYLSWKLPQGGFEKFQVNNSAAIIQHWCLMGSLFHSLFLSFLLRNDFGNFSTFNIRFSSKVNFLFTALKVQGYHGKSSNMNQSWYFKITVFNRGRRVHT